jgi:hypothetical protein
MNVSIRQLYSRRSVSNLREICESTVRYCRSLNAVLAQLENCHLVIILRLSSKQYSGICYSDRMLQRTVFISNIRMLQRARRNTIGRRSTRLRMTCRAFPIGLQRQLSSLLSFVRFSLVQLCAVYES